MIVQIEIQKAFFNYLALELKEAWQNKKDVNLTNKAYI